MPDYITASRTKDHFQAQLLREHPEVVSIAPQLKIDDNGQPTKEAVIVIGVRARNLLRTRPGAAVSPHTTAIPTQLPVVDTQGKLLANQYVEVVIEDVGEIVPHMNVARMRPCPGGFSVGHTRVRAGTLGGNVRFASNFGFILSCNHVLAAVNSGAVGDPIVQPGVLDGGNVTTDTIAQLTRWVPIDLTGGNNEVDCAIARELTPGNLNRIVQGIGTPTAVANGTVGQAVRKSGRTTQLTTGSILSDNATIQITYGVGQVGTFVNQLQYTKMCAPGDSGSFIWDQSALTVVGLHFAGDTVGTNCYGNKMLRVLELLSQTITAYGFKGAATHFPKENLSLIDQP